ncbi:MAG: hypothetical protein KC493_04650 [Bacteriovoracaceae bacterium]|nr:hypothetical protein [Bacteriovoracaceae bacterium]
MSNEPLTKSELTEDAILSREFFDNFRDWLDLNLEGLTWQGRYRDEFEQFWEMFFIDGLSLLQISERFVYASERVKIGPLTSWFHWLKEKFICFVFMKRQLSVGEISEKMNVTPTIVAGILRNFLIDGFPHLDEEFNSFFQIPHRASSNLNLTYADLVKKFDLPETIKRSLDDDIMPSMEVTLYAEWGELLEKSKKEIFHSKLNIKKLRRDASFGQQFKIFREFVLFIVLGFLIVTGVQSANKWYKKYLTNKISIYEPQFKWLNKKLTFKAPRDDKSEKGFTLDLKDIEKIDDSKEEDNIYREEERFETESEVVLTSWDSLPKDFNVADLEESSYEEIRKGGYRDTRFGNKKVYRVMMKSVNSIDAKGQLNGLLNKYKVKQVDKVKPGKFVPGGVYYNLFVPRQFLKEFLAQVMDIDDSILYESRTRGRNPPGKNKVFIWIKNI